MSCRIALLVPPIAPSPTLTPLRTWHPAVRICRGAKLAHGPFTKSVRETDRRRPLTSQRPRKTGTKWSVFASICAVARAHPIKADATSPARCWELDTKMNYSMLPLELSLENMHLSGARRGPAAVLLRTCLRQSLPAILADETSNEARSVSKTERQARLRGVLTQLCHSWGKGQAKAMDRGSINSFGINE